MAQVSEPGHERSLDWFKLPGDTWADIQEGGGENSSGWGPGQVSVVHRSSIDVEV